MDMRMVKQLVRQFMERTGATGSEANCFAPWYLHNRYQLGEGRALEQSSDGNFDFGIDAFHLYQSGDGRPSLLLMQAKYSESLPLIGKGVREIEKVLPEIGRSLDGMESETPIQNKVLVNLRAALNRLAPEARRDLELDLQVLHLSTEDEAILGVRLGQAMERLREAVGEALPNQVCRIRQVGPRDLGPAQVVVAPPEEVPLQLDGVHRITAGEGNAMFTGMGRLADLVDLYIQRRDDLFSRNVRYYLKSKKNTEKGPAGKMRATLKQMCVEGRVDPELFALYHNGITMVSRRATLVDGHVRLRDPYVLNGCQTIKNAFLFRYEKSFKSSLREDLWSRVVVPVRIIETTDDDLVRAVTVNNNRQNAMSPAALRANDPVQISLEYRFKERHILYQRQEGGFDAVWLTRPEMLEDEYENTQGSYVDIHDIARAIAAAAGEMRIALKPNDLFESDTAYGRCFDEKKRLRSIALLTFLQNLHDAMRLVLSKDLQLTPKAGGPKVGKLTYHAICLFLRYLARERMSEFILTWGQQLHYKKKPFREEVRKVLNSNKAGLRAEMNKQFMTLQSTSPFG